MHGFVFDVAHLLAGSLVLLSIMLLYQDRMFALINIFALHAVALVLSVIWQAYIQGQTALYVTAAIAFSVKAIVIPLALRRIVRNLGIHKTIETVVGIEDTAHDELRRDSAVPVVLVQAERDVVPSVTAVAVELRSLTERNRPTRIAAVALHAEPKMLPVSHRRQLPELAAGREQGDVGIGETERREPQAQAIFDELEVEEGGARRHPLESQTFRSLLGEPALLRAA